MRQEGFVTTAFGRNHYVREGDGLPLVLLHSNGNSLHEYDGVRAALAQDFELIVADMPGQGDSDPLTRHLSIDDYADAVVALLDALRVERTIVMGASVGGCIAASLGARPADRIAGLGIIETQYRSRQWWAQNWPAIERMFSITAQTVAQIEARFHTSATELVERVNIDRHKAGGFSMMSAMWAIREFDIRAAVAKITTPTLLLFGTDGPTFETAEEFRSSLPAASFEVIAGAGHFPMIDHPHEFVDAVRRFGASLGSG